MTLSLRSALSREDGAVLLGGCVSEVTVIPRFSVVIPAFNEERLIGECLQSLARQDFAGGYEVIVVDNNCTDDTAEIGRASCRERVSKQV